ncbi:MAG TPA: pitrilysin family protein [Vicinamibacterales bacterium]|nr:pitrilysin family protein [Vicinamibacterales bacterium]
MALILATALAGVQPAQFPSEAPKAGVPKDFRVPEPRRFALENGLQVALVQWGSMPKVRVTLDIRTGNAFEKRNEVWLADLTGQLIREGTAARNATTISREAARMGGSLGIGVGGDSTTIGGDVLSEFGPAMVDLVADVVSHPAFPESELARLKTNLTRTLAVSLSQPQQVALETFRSVMYGDHPYARVFPTQEMLQGYTLAQARDFYTATYGAGRARLYVVGSFDAVAMEASIRKAFGAWSKGAPAEPLPPKPSSSRAVHLIDRPGAPQSTIILGMPTIDPSSEDYVALTVMDALLGGAFASRITKNIREDKGYTYSPYSEISARYRDAYWAENADVTTAQTGLSLKEIFAEIDRLQSQPPSEQELAGIRNYLAGTYILQNSSRGGITAQLEFIDLHGLPPTHPNTYVQRVFAVTPQKVMDVARKYLQDDTATIVVVGDRKVIEEQLKPFGKIIIKSN